MTDLLLYVIAPFALLAAGGIATARRKRMTDEAQRLRYARLATGFFGSAVIVWLVAALGPVLQFVAIAILVALLFKHLFFGRAFLANFFFSKRG